MSTATVIRTQAEVPTASMADLLHTYTQLTGTAVKRFASRAAAERRVIDAIMAAADKAGHAGVGRGVKPAPKTVAERVQEASDKGKDPKAQLPDADGQEPQDGVEVDDSVNPYPIGTMAHGLWIATKAAKKVEPRPKAAPRDPNAPKRRPVDAVRATFAGKSQPQAGSERNSVLVYIQSKKDAKGNPLPVTMTDLEAHFQKNCRGFVQKLLEKEHIVLVEVADESSQGAAQ